MKRKALARLDEVTERYAELACCRGDMEAVLALMEAGFRTGGRLYVCGNGGSCADAFHVAGELMKSFVLPRPLAPGLRANLKRLWPESAEYLLSHLQGGLPAQSLCGEPALMSAFANDEAADLCFAQQVAVLGRRGDVFLGISTSGCSENVVHAARVAKAAGLGVAALTGRDGGELARVADAAIVVPRRETYAIQELHLPVYHALCLALEEEFFGGGE